MKNAGSAHLIRSSRSVRALGSAVRQEIVDVVESAGPSTIADVARTLARRPDALYFHVRALERAGLVKRVGEVGEGRNKAAVFDVPGRPMRLDYSGAPTARAARLGSTLDCLLRLARRDVRRALEGDGVVGEGPHRDLWVARARGRVGRGDLERINALLDECARIVRDAKAGPDGHPIALAFALTPVVAHRDRALRPSSGAGPTGSRRRSS